MSFIALYRRNVGPCSVLYAWKPLYQQAGNLKTQAGPHAQAHKAFGKAGREGKRPTQFLFCGKSVVYSVTDMTDYGT